jgi:hypothetical protein
MKYWHILITTDFVSVVSPWKRRFVIEASRYFNTLCDTIPPLTKCLSRAVQPCSEASVYTRKYKEYVLYGTAQLKLGDVLIVNSAESDNQNIALLIASVYAIKVRHLVFQNVFAVQPFNIRKKRLCLHSPQYHVLNLAFRVNQSRN